MEPGRRTGVHLRSKSWEGVLGAGDRCRLAKKPEQCEDEGQEYESRAQPCSFFNTATAAASA
jgi:hypothetical protein